jgi:hypothetical protein
MAPVISDSGSSPSRRGRRNSTRTFLTQLSTLIALGVASPQDRDAVKAWVDGNFDREQAKRVAAL